ncbi:glycosyltransferase family 4 protein [Staphylococcus equorum]|uniref:glycosyltransferase family 4 protein n=1 Tax=Staphylococcus equorum TaxID=246432 RepID=UPI0008FD8E1F|nr:hypothetical protein BFN02_05080 [Staphylococcus equorum]
MKVIHINSDYGNTIYKALSEKLFNLGIEQKVYKFTRPNLYKGDIYNDYVDVRVNHKNYERYIFHLKHKKVLKDFLNLYKEEKIDLIHAHTLFSNGYIAYKVFKKKNIPYIVTVRGTDISVFFKYMKHLNGTGLRILLNAKEIIFVSPAHKSIIINKYIPKKYKKEILDKITVIPNGIDSYYIENLGPPKTIDFSKEIRIITPAWINNNKNQLNLCKAIQLLNNRGFNIKYSLIGGTENKNKYKKLKEKLDSYEFVEILPRVNKIDLLQEYRNCTITAMVSFKETFGLSYIESLSQSTPIIYSENRGIDGYFEEGEVGYHANPFSIKDIADSIEKTINDYNQLSKNAGKHISEFRWINIAKQIAEIYIK